MERSPYRRPGGAELPDLEVRQDGAHGDTAPAIWMSQNHSPVMTAHSSHERGLLDRTAMSSNTLRPPPTRAIMNRAHPPRCQRTGSTLG